MKDSVGLVFCKKLEYGKHIKLGRSHVHTFATPYYWYQSVIEWLGMTSIGLRMVQHIQKEGHHTEVEIAQ